VLPWLTSLKWLRAPHDPSIASCHRQATFPTTTDKVQFTINVSHEPTVLPSTRSQSPEEASRNIYPGGVHALELFGLTFCSSGSLTRPMGRSISDRSLPRDTSNPKQGQSAISPEFCVIADAQSGNTLKSPGFGYCPCLRIRASPSKAPGGDKRLNRTSPTMRVRLVAIDHPRPRNCLLNSWRQRSATWSTGQHREGIPEPQQLHPTGLLLQTDLGRIPYIAAVQTTCHFLRRQRYCSHPIQWKRAFRATCSTQARSVAT